MDESDEPKKSVLAQASEDAMAVDTMGGQHGQALSITVMSYAGAMGFGFTTARSAIPDASELSAALLAALDELVACSPGAAAAPTKLAPRKAVAKKVVKRERPPAGRRAA